MEPLEGYSRQVTWQKASLWQTQRPQLDKLDIELTERCNFGCVHCYINQSAGDQAIKAREMSTAQVQAILDEAAALGALEVRFTGGEPLLREDFSEIYLHARRLGMRVTLFTNGSLVTPELADLFARVPPMQPIEISIYGMTPQGYATVTGVQGAYRAVRRGIELLVERQVWFLVKELCCRRTKRRWRTSPPGRPPCPAGSPNRHPA